MKWTNAATKATSTISTSTIILTQATTILRFVVLTVTNRKMARKKRPIRNEEDENEIINF